METKALEIEADNQAANFWKAINEIKKYHQPTLKATTVDIHALMDDCRAMIMTGNPKLAADVQNMIKYRIERLCTGTLWEYINQLNKIDIPTTRRVLKDADQTARGIALSALAKIQNATIHNPDELVAAVKAARPLWVEYACITYDISEDCAGWFADKTMGAKK